MIDAYYQSIYLLAHSLHESVNQKYDGKPYSTHLLHAFQVFKKFKHLIPKREYKDFTGIIGAAVLLHDTIEDCRETRNDIAKKTSEDIAELVYAVTNEKGRTRKERANSKYYRSIRWTYGATFVKLCDRIANVEYSKQKGSGMFNKYKSENIHFVKSLKPNLFERIIFLFSPYKKINYTPMFDYLENLFNG